MLNIFSCCCKVDVVEVNQPAIQEMDYLIVEPDIFIESVIPYPGDLVQPGFAPKREGNSLQININPTFNVTIRNQDIFVSGANVIVNAANTHLGGGGGIDGLIHDRGGESYATAHRELQTKYNSSYVEGHASIIQSGMLKDKYVIERVIVVAGPQGESTQEKENQLYSCYYNSLLLAHSNMIKSIAFPAISTGIFGFPMDRAAHISLRAISDFIKYHPDSTVKTISIHFLSDDGLGYYSEAAK